MVRESWKMVLERNDRLKVIALCDNGLSAIEQTQKLLPDILLVDVNMSPLNGFAVTKKVTETNPGIKIIALSVNNQIYYVQRMMELKVKTLSQRPQRKNGRNIGKIIVILKATLMNASPLPL